MEKERGKLPRVDCNAVDELNAYVARHVASIETMTSNIYIYIYLVWKSFDFRQSATKNISISITLSPPGHECNCRGNCNDTRRAS